MADQTDDLSAEALDRLSDEELRATYGHETDPARLRGLAEALTEWELDPSIRAYVATLAREKQHVVTELLLAARGVLLPADLEFAYGCIAEAIEGYWCGFDGFTGAIARQLDGPSLDDLVLPRFRRAIFCTDLLLSFQAHQQTVPAVWVAEIRRRRADEGFVEHFSDLEPALRRLDMALASVQG